MKQRQVEMGARHLEELKVLEAKHAAERDALEAKFGQINELERVIGGFVEEYLEPSPADVPPDPSGATAPKPVEADTTKRWRERFGLA